MHVQASPRRGFTLLELLVVIAVMAILIALLLPAVHQVREAARRVQCQNHLKQLGLAFHTYHDVSQSFPFGRQAHVVFGRVVEHNWAPSLLPALEQAPLYSLYNWDVTWNDPQSQAAITTPVSVFLCPSNRMDAGQLDVVGNGLFAARSDYAPPLSIAEAPLRAGLLPRPKSVLGSLENNKTVRMVEITDGTSQTLQLIEDAGRPQSWVAAGPGPVNNAPGGGNRPIINGRVEGGGWASRRNPIPLHTFTRDGLRVPGACAINCTNNNEAFSFHPGGILTQFVDGSVQFLNENIALAVYAALLTRAGEEIIGGDSF